MSLTPAGEQAFERYWPPLNRRRAHLIRASREAPLMAREREEYHCLERVADLLLGLIAMPLKRIEDITNDPDLIRRCNAEVQRGSIRRAQAEWKAVAL